MTSTSGSQFAEALGIPGAATDDWAGPVRVQRVPPTGAGNALAQTPEPVADAAPASTGSACDQTGGTTVPVTSGPRARLLVQRAGGGAGERSGGGQGDHRRR